STPGKSHPFPTRRSSDLASAEQYKTVGEAVADCRLVLGTTAVRHRELQHPVRRLDEGARLIRKCLKSQRVALLFGSEKTGLSNRSEEHTSELQSPCNLVC